MSRKASDASLLPIFNHLFASVAEEMGLTLERAAYSPNIKERLDFSCALFLGDGRLLAQAAHIPVHLGAMRASVQAAMAACAPFAPGDVVMLNDPYLGGNHLPDITVVSPVFLEATAPDSPTFFVASRAHHADVGGMSPGSMPLSREIYQEGIIIPPLKIVAGGVKNEAVWQLILRNVRTPQEREGDLAAQLAAHQIGERRLQEIVARYGLAETLAQGENLLAYTARLTAVAIQQIPDGNYNFTDYLDNDGQSPDPIPLCVTLTVAGDNLAADFAGSSTAVAGNLNTVPAVVSSALAYCLRCVTLALLQTDLPMNDGAYHPLALHIPTGSLLNPHPPHAVAAGNVETSQRLTDVIFGALAHALPQLIPAASQGTMNNLTFGGRDNRGQIFAYYETMGGGCGAGPQMAGASGIHSHMSNTLNTPIEALESSFPVRVRRYELRTGSGGQGQFAGGEGLIRTLEFLTPAQITLTTERRTFAPYGLAGGTAGQPGQNRHKTSAGWVELPGKISLQVEAGDLIEIATPGGGGWGRADGDA
jgi:N-methylhydantoinase B/oxoprolinase/acetone carboxylase alpha subunit